MDFPDDPVGWAQKLEWLLNTAKKIGDKLMARKANQLPGREMELEVAGVYLVEKRGVVTIVGLGNWSAEPDTVKQFSLEIDGHAVAPDYPGTLGYSVPRREVDTSRNWKCPRIRVEERPQ